MTDPQHDRNLLVGILALQMDFINRDQLIAAMQEWLLNKQARLEDILLAKRSLRQDTYEFLVAMVAKHLEVHGGDAGEEPGRPQFADFRCSTICIPPGRRCRCHAESCIDRACRLRAHPPPAVRSWPTTGRTLSAC